MDDMIKKKTWREFQAHGLLWFVNTMLHVFGWAIVIEKNEFNNIVDVYPARVKFRGFNEETITKHSKSLTEYMATHAHKLLNDFDKNNEIE